MESLDLPVLAEALAWRRSGHEVTLVTVVQTWGSDRPAMIAYGVSQEEAARFGLACGGTLRLVQEPLTDAAWIEEVLRRTASQRLVSRTLTLATGQVALTEANRGLHGPVGLRIGAKTLAEIAVSIIAQIVKVKNARPAIAGASSAVAAMN